MSVYHINMNLRATCLPGETEAWIERKQSKSLNESDQDENIGRYVVSRDALNSPPKEYHICQQVSKTFKQTGGKTYILRHPPEP